jgi:hypothetical protein
LSYVRLVTELNPTNFFLLYDVQYSLHLQKHHVRKTKSKLRDLDWYIHTLYGNVSFTIFLKNSIRIYIILRNCIKMCLPFICSSPIIACFFVIWVCFASKEKIRLDSFKLPIFELFSFLPLVWSCVIFTHIFLVLFFWGGGCILEIYLLLGQNPCSFWILGLLYTWSQGQCSTQIQHSYWCKSWNQPQGLYTRSPGWNRKILFNLPQVLINAELYGVVLGTKAGKRIPSNLGGQNLQPLGPDVNVVAFISNLGPICNPKMLKVGPKFFWGPDT